MNRLHKLELFLVFTILFTFVESSINVAAYKSRIRNCPYSGLKTNECQNPLTPRLHEQNVKYRLQLGIAYNKYTGASGLPVLYNGEYTQNITTKNNRTYTIPSEYSVYDILTNYSFDQKLFKRRSEFNDYVYNDTKLFPNGIQSNIIDLENKFNGVSDIVLTTLAYPLYNLSYRPHVYRLDDSMVEVLDMLPNEYDQEIYYQFIDQWGTDVIVSAIVGGQAQRITYAKTCYIHTTGIDILNQEEIRLNNQLKFKYTGNVAIDNTYSQYSSAQVINIFGGNPIIFDSNDWNKRVDSFDSEYSVFINFKTVPIHDFMDNIRKKHIQRAIEERYHMSQQNISIPVTASLTYNGLSWVNPLMKETNLTYDGSTMYDFCDMVDYQRLLKPYYFKTMPQCGWTSITGTGPLKGVCGKVYNKICHNSNTFTIDNHRQHCRNTLNYKFSCNMDNNGYVWVSTPMGSGQKVNTGCSNYNMQFGVPSPYISSLDRMILMALDRPIVNNVHALCCVDNQFYLNNLVCDAGILQSQCKKF